MSGSPIIQAWLGAPGRARSLDLRGLKPARPLDLVGPTDPFGGIDLIMCYPTTFPNPKSSGFPGSLAQQAFGAGIGCITRPVWIRGADSQPEGFSVFDPGETESLTQHVSVDLLVKPAGFFLGPVEARERRRTLKVGG